MAEKSRQVLAYEEQVARDKKDIDARLAQPSAFNLFEEGAPVGDVLRNMVGLSDGKGGPGVLRGVLFADGHEYTLDTDNLLLIDGVLLTVCTLSMHHRPWLIAHLCRC